VAPATTVTVSEGRADLDVEVPKSEFVIGHQDDVGAFEFLETRSFDREFVGRGGHLREDKAPLGIGDGGQGEAFGGIGEFDGSVGDGGFVGVGNAAGNGATGGLREGEIRRHKNQEE